MTKLLVETGLENYDEEDTATGRAVSPLALLGVVSLAIAPTLLATGHTLVGGLAGVVAAAYVTLWVTATDHLLEEALGDARDELRAVGGVTGFFRAVIYDDRVVDEPETLVERLTYADVAAAVVFATVTVVALPFAVAEVAGVLDAVLELLGGLGALAVLVVLVGGVWVTVVLLGVSAISTLAVASARHTLAEDADATPGGDA